MLVILSRAKNLGRSGGATALLSKKHPRARFFLGRSGGATAILSKKHPRPRFFAAAAGSE